MSPRARCDVAESIATAYAGDVVRLDRVQIEPDEIWALDIEIGPRASMGAGPVPGSAVYSMHPAQRIRVMLEPADVTALARLFDRVLRRAKGGS